MRISVNEVKNLNNKLKVKISLYESKYLQYYNYMNHVQKDWYDHKAKLFFETLEEDKKKDYDTLQELTSIYNLYEFIANNYLEIGNEIEYEPEKKDEIIELLDNIINKSNTIINIYNNLGINKYSERSKLYQQKNNYMNILEKAKRIKNNILKTSIKIEDIEKTSKEEMSKLTITPIQEKDITPYK